MYFPYKISRLIFFAAIVVFGGHFAFSQSEAKEPATANFYSTLYLLVGSSEEGRPMAETPKELMPALRQIRESFPDGSLKLVNTLTARLGNEGSVEYKSVSNIFGIEKSGEVPDFLEWQITGLRSAPSETNARHVEIRNFRLGARIPVRMPSAAPESGRPAWNTSYENVGLTVVRLGVEENTPAVIGSIALPNMKGTVFLVLTVRRI